MNENKVVDLTPEIDVKGTETLNSEQNAIDLLKGSSNKLCSDADEQLMFNIQFNGEVKVVDFCIMGPSGGSAPAVIKLFNNRSNLTFSDVEELDADQVIKLSAEDVEIGNYVTVAATKFSQCHNFTMFIESNQGDEEVTVITSFSLRGIPRVIRGSGIDRKPVQHSRFGDALNPM